MSALAEAISGPPHRASLKECYEHTDLAWRLAQIPDTAACRGVFLNMLDERAGELGPSTQYEYRQFFQTYRFTPFRFYPVKDYLTRIVTLAQIHYGGPEIYRGVFEIQAAAYPSWKRTLMGRAMFAMLGNDFHALLRAIDKTYATHSFVNYCRFAVHPLGPGRYRALFEPEYLYIEHAMAGALWGVAKACGVRVKLEPRLDDPFNGTIDITIL
jgi:uncharacterized protein (TIGR02265 family)